MSLPWIITEHIVKTKRAMALETASSTGPSEEHSRTMSSGTDISAAVMKGLGTDQEGALKGYGGGKGRKKGKGRDGGAMGHVLVEEVLWALDLYNDAAHKALYLLNSQYLFNEIQVQGNTRMIPVPELETVVPLCPAGPYLGASMTLADMAPVGEFGPTCVGARPAPILLISVVHGMGGGLFELLRLWAGSGLTECPSL